MLAGPLALVLATALGYVLAGAGLRPVEAMRRRAAAITAGARERLPVRERGTRSPRLADDQRDARAARGGVRHERRFVADPVTSCERRSRFAHRARASRCTGRGRTRSSRTHSESAAEETDRLAARGGSAADRAADQGSCRCGPSALCSELLEGVADRFGARGQPGETLTCSPATTVIDATGAPRAGDRQPRRQRARHGAGTVGSRRRAVGARSSCMSPTRAGLARRLRRSRVRPLQPRRRGSPGQGHRPRSRIVHAIAVAHGGAAHVHAEGTPADIYITLPTTPEA